MSLTTSVANGEPRLATPAPRKPRRGTLFFRELFLQPGYFFTGNIVVGDARTDREDGRGVFPETVLEVQFRRVQDEVRAPGKQAHAFVEHRQVSTRRNRIRVCPDL